MPLALHVHSSHYSRSIVSEAHSLASVSLAAAIMHHSMAVSVEEVNALLDSSFVLGVGGVVVISPEASLYCVRGIGDDCGISEAE